MNARVEKEIRTQSPVLGLLAACTVAMLAVNNIQAPYRFIETEPTLIGIYFLCCLLMAAMTFGNEFHLRTMSLLLSQPVARRELWPEKMRVLAAVNAIGALVVLVALTCTTQVRRGAAGKETLVLCATLVFVPILFCCTTPYFTLISRSTLGGMVFSIFSAGMLLALSGWIWDQVSILGLGRIKDKLTFGQLDGPTLIFVILSIPYCALLYWLGRRRFLRLEVIDSQALEANLPQGLETTLANFSARFKSPFSRLLFKELRLQRISLMLTAAFCLFMAVERLTWNSTNERTFIVAGTLYIYVFLFPVIVCATAVAEEKTWGMKDWHLTLPPSLNKQWRVKWLVALTLSLTLGAGLTWFLARSGPWHKELGLNFVVEYLCYPLLIGAALYAGSISTSTIRALLLTFGIVAAFTFINGTLFATMDASFFSQDTTVSLIFVLGSMLVELYQFITRLLYNLVWNLIVCPVWWATHSVEKTRAASSWVYYSVFKHLPAIFLALCVVGACGLILRFARANYRHSDLSKRKIALQLAILLLVTLFIGLALARAQNGFDAWNGPQWTLLPLQPFMR